MKKAIIVIAIIFVIFIVGILLYLGVKEKKVVVLAYHKVVPSEIKKKIIMIIHGLILLKDLKSK